jgi:hypothetical protein
VETATGRAAEPPLSHQGGQQGRGGHARVSHQILRPVEPDVVEHRQRAGRQAATEPHHGIDVGGADIALFAQVSGPIQVSQQQSPPGSDLSLLYRHRHS